LDGTWVACTVTGQSLPGGIVAFGHGTRANPGIFDKDYLFLTALAASLRRGVEDIGGSELVVLDVGSTWKPYRRLFAGRATRFYALDIGPPTDMDVVASADCLPIRRDAADVCLCTQVLEHVEDPARVVAELSRAVRPDGTLLLSTHGVFHHHPYPHDYWRWTAEGLRKLLLEHFEEVEIHPNGGTILLLFHVIGRGVFYLAEHRAWLRILQYTIYPLLNVLAGPLDRVAHDTSLSLNYLAVARRPRRHAGGAPR
jgi:SAM-dependent methyltransferase